MIKTRTAFTGSLNDGKNPRFIAINHTEVPCTADQLKKNGKPTAVAFTILRPLSAGFASAPYKLKDKNRDPDAKPLSALSYKKSESGTTKPVMTMHSYQRVGKSDKGPRSEISWTLEAGNTVLLWLDEERLKEDKGKDDPLLPEGVATIPAFSVCEISIGPKSEESSKKGSSTKIITVRVATYTLYSLQADLAHLSQGLADARTLQLTARDEQPAIAKDLVVKDVPFWSAVSKAAFIDDSEITAHESVRLVNWGDPLIPQIDIPIDVLMKYTNCPRVDWACALLESAIAASAVSVLVFSNDFWKGTGFKAIPVIDTEVLLADVKTAKSAHPAVYDTLFRTEVEGNPHTLQIVMYPEPISVESGAPPACDDFALVGLHAELQVAHAVDFNLVNTNTRDVVPAVWRGYFNASPAPIAAVCSKRKRWATMDE
jgi:hypothetical protein